MLPAGALLNTLRQREDTTSWTHVQCPVKGNPMCADSPKPIVAENNKVDEWRLAVALELRRKGHHLESEQFAQCGKSDKPLYIATCPGDASHYSKPVFETCHLRICPDCERRANAQRMAKYLPLIEDAFNFPQRGYSLKHIILTTDISIFDPDVRESYAKAWNSVRSCMEHAIFAQMKRRATPAEKRRQRIDLAKHDMGMLAASEFGERGLKLHFHLLFYGCYIPQKALSDAWKQATYDNAQVTYIKRVQGSFEAASEVILKYVTKFSESCAVEAVKLYEVLKGHRRIRSYGIWYNTPDDEEEHPHECPHCERRIVYMRISTWIEHGARSGLYFSSNGEITSGRDPAAEQAIPPDKPPGEAAVQPELPLMPDKHSDFWL